MNKYEKYKLQKYSSMKNPSNLCNKINIDNEAVLTRMKNKNICSIKPLFYENPKDINLNDIFIHVINSHILFNGENDIYIKLSEEQKIKRQYVIESIKKFIHLYKIRYEIVYNIIFLFDILIYLDDKFRLIKNIEQLGLGSTILMIKYMHVENKIFNLNIFQNFYERKHYPKIILKEIEILCLKLINYYLNFPTPLLLLELYFVNGFIFKNDNIKTDTCFKLYKMALSILEKILVSSNEYTKYRLINLSSGIISYCRQYYGLEKWPNILNKIYGINENNFEGIIKEFLSDGNNLNLKTISIKNKLLDKKLQEKNVIFKKCNRNINDDNNKQKESNEIDINHINKDIKVNKNNYKEEKSNSRLSIFKINNSNMNINLTYRTTEEIKNSALFKKININFSKKLKDLNISNSSNSINKKNFINTISNKEKTIENKKPIISYKTPDKILNNKNSTCDNKENKKEENSKIHKKDHHRNISNIIISNKNDNFLDSEQVDQVLFKRDEINCSESNKDTINNIKERSININKNEERKIYKKFINHNNGELNTEINLNEKEEIKVKLKQFHYQNKNINEHKKMIAESKLVLGNKDNVNNNSKIIINNIYKKNFLLKNNNNSMNLKNSNNEKDNIIKKKSDDLFIKNISLFK